MLVSNIFRNGWNCLFLLWNHSISLFPTLRKLRSKNNDNNNDNNDNDDNDDNNNNKNNNNNNILDYIRLYNDKIIDLETF